MLKKFLAITLLFGSTTFNSAPANAWVDLVCDRFPALDTAYFYDVGCFINYYEHEDYLIPNVDWVSNAMQIYGTFSSCGGASPSSPSTTTTEYYYDYPEYHPFDTDYLYFELSNHNGGSKWWPNQYTSTKSWWSPLSHKMDVHYKQGNTIIFYDSEGPKHHTIEPSCP